MSTKLIMRRSGEFQCDWSHSDGKCGADTNLHPKYYYLCEIVAKPSLDQNDFLIDQLDINKYFQTRYRYEHKPRSCERIALNAVSDISALLNHHFQEHHGASIHQIVTNIRISIGFNVEAVMTAEWTPDRKRKKWLTGT